MSPGDQIIQAFISTFFDVIVSVLVSSFDAIVVPILQAVPTMLGIG